MAFQRNQKKVTVADLENFAFALARVDRECLNPIISYLRQGRTAADAQQLQNAYDLQEAIRKVRLKLLTGDPDRE